MAKTLEKSRNYLSSLEILAVMKSLPPLHELTITQIKELISGETSPELIKALENDPRKGVQALALAVHRSKEHQSLLHQRWQEMSCYEEEYWSKGVVIAGVDEAGRGPLAGPVVAAAVILPVNCYLPGLADSKTLSHHQRSRLLDKITVIALDYSVGIVGPELIDELNIFQATQLAMKKAVDGLDKEFAQVFIDGNQPCKLLQSPQRTIIKGDSLSVSIAAASIIAKETRDELMTDLDSVYPGYGFADHKGYGTPEHLAALNDLGPSPIHRRSFAPVAALCREEQASGEQCRGRKSR